MKQKRSNIWAYFVDALFLLGVVIALFTQQSFILIFWALPFVFFDRSYIIPLFMVIPLLEGALNLEASIPSETILIVTYLPFIIFDLFKNMGFKIPLAYRRIFYFFLLLIVFGTIVGILSTEGNIPSKDILIDNLQKFLKVFFFFLYMYFLVGHGFAFVLRGIKHLTFITPLLLVAIFVYMRLFGLTEGYQDMLNFGSTKHGEFTASLVAISVYSLWHFFSKKMSIVSRIFILVTMLLTVWIILLSGSRNGLVSFVIMILTTIYFFIGFHVRFKNILIILLLLVPVVYFIVDNQETVTIQRLKDFAISRQGVEGSGIKRIYLWQGAWEGFLEKPLTGQGGSTQISRAVERRTSRIDNVVHNTFLEITLQYGIFGIIVFIILQLMIYKGTRMINLVELRDDPDLNRIMIPFISYISLFFSGMFLSWIWSSIIWYNICIIFAIVILMSARQNERKSIPA